LTYTGTNALRKEALIDDSDQLTELGNTYAYAADVSELPDATNAPPPNTEPQTGMNTSSPTQNVDRNQMPSTAPVEAGAGAASNEFASFDIMKRINAASIALID
jgi:hypothetical protein